MRRKIEEHVMLQLETYCFDDRARISDEISVYGDAEIKSIYFIEILPFIEIEFGIKIPEKEIHKNINSSFNSFCDLVERLVKN